MSRGGGGICRPGAGHNGDDEPLAEVENWQPFVETFLQRLFSRAGNAALHLVQSGRAVWFGELLRLPATSANELHHAFEVIGLGEQID